MTHPTDEELDEMARDLSHTGELSMLYRCEIADAITALRAQLADARAERDALHVTYDELYADALADAKSDAQDFDSDLWIGVRKYLTELNLDWRDYQDDGILADQAIEYIRECMDCETRRADRAEAALAASIPTVQETGIDIAAIENGGRRWHGEDHRIVSVRWEPYKPDGQRQMKAKGRWQEQVGSGDYWRWQNCDRPAALAKIKGADHE